MKLRVRSLETKETLKISLSDDCSLDHLRDSISKVIPSSSSSSSFVHISLNCKDDLCGSSPQQSLRSLGITSGDLIFFTLNPSGFSSERPISQFDPNSGSSRGPVQTLTLNPDSQIAILEIQEEEIDSGALGLIDTEKDRNLDDMDVDGDGDLGQVGKSFSVPSFLRKVFRKEIGDGGGRDHKLLVIAIHAVLTESGFVGFDSVSNMIFDGFHVPDVWPSSAFTMSLTYTLPEIVGKDPLAVNGVPAVVLKFQALGKFLNIYGSLVKKGNGGLYRVCLDEDRLVPFLNVVWANSESSDELSGMDLLSGINFEKEVFSFWKTVKDKLALPLLIDLCEQAGLPPPPCFMRLPTDLKTMILESLSGVDLARLGCVCSELRYLSSDDDLWLKKIVEKFGDVESRTNRWNTWKEKFGNLWGRRKRRMSACSISRRHPNYELPYAMRGRRDPNPLGVPAIIGGAHDAAPALGIPSSMLLQFQYTFRNPQNFRTHCNLGGPNA